MNAIEFMSKLQGQGQEPSQLPAKDFFETPEGKIVLRFLSQHVEVVDEKSFRLVDDDITGTLSKISSYAGRNLFQDMESLGFTWKCISHHQDEAPICTYLFTTT